MEGFYDILEIKVFGRIYEILDEDFHERMNDDDLKNYVIESRFNNIAVWHPRSNDDENNRLLVEIDGTKFDVKLYDMYDEPPENEHITSKKSDDSDSEVYSDGQGNYYPQYRESPEINGIKFKYRQRRISLLD